MRRRESLFFDLYSLYHSEVDHLPFGDDTSSDSGSSSDSSYSTSSSSSASSSGSDRFDPLEYFLSAPFFIAVTFLLCMIICCFRIIKMFQYKHNPRSLENVIYFLDAIWSLLRVLYFVVDPFIDGWWMYVTIYAFPTNVQVAVFMLMLLYCAQRVHYDHWNQKKAVLYTLYGVVNGGLLLLYVAYAIVSLLGDNNKWIVLSMSGVFLVCFASLIIGFVIYTVLFAKQKHCHALFKHESRKALLALMIVITICLTIRCIWDIINLCEAHSLPLFSDKITDQLTIVGLFLTWEIIPLLSVIVFFGKIPHAAASVVIPSSPVGSYSGSYSPTGGNSRNGSGSALVMPPSPSVTGRSDETIPLLQESRQPTLIPSDASSVNSDVFERATQPLQPSASVGMMQQSTASNTSSTANNSSNHSSSNTTHSVVMRGTCPLVHSDGSTPIYCFVAPELADLQNDGRVMYNNHAEFPLHSQQ